MGYLAGRIGGRGILKEGNAMGVRERGDER